MNTDIKVLSVVIPAFNIEKYIDETLQSFIASAVFSELEILIVNDGSVDGTKIKAESYSNKYPNNIRLINKENAGHGSTINVGIKEATGKYFKVVDGDDWVDSEGLVRVVEKLKTETADMAVTGYTRVINKESKSLYEIVTEKNVENDVLYSFDEICKQMEPAVFHSIIYKTQILKNNNVVIDEKCYYVDQEYITYPIIYIDTIIFYRDNLYMYRLGEEGQSVSRISLQKNIKQLIRVSKNVSAYLMEKKESISDTKYSYLTNVAKGTNEAVISTLGSLPDNKRENERQIKRFDIEAKRINEDVFNCVGDRYRLLRLLGYRMTLHAIIMRILRKVRGEEGKELL